MVQKSNQLQPGKIAKSYTTTTQSLAFTYPPFPQSSLAGPVLPQGQDAGGSGLARLASRAAQKCSKSL